MKICPTCNQTYSDETLNFCLNDGAVLNKSNTSDASPPTAFMGQTPPTSPNTPFGNQTAQVNWGTQQPQFTKPVRKSRAGLWIVGIVGLLLLFGAIGVVGLIGLVAINDNDSDPPKVVAGDFTNSNYKTVLKEDFSTWRQETNDYGKTEYRSGDFVMSSKQAGAYYVLITGRKEYKTTNASTKVTVKNVNGTTTNLGYGLIVHSDPFTPLSKDYVFLIDSTTQSYRVAMHIANKETSLIKWTRFSSIRNGTQPNDVEVKDEDGKMTFYINGQMATTLQNTSGYKDGVTGIYVGDGIPIAFSNLKLGK